MNQVRGEVDDSPGSWLRPSANAVGAVLVALVFAGCTSNKTVAALPPEFLGRWQYPCSALEECTRFQLSRTVVVHSGSYLPFSLAWRYWVLTASSDWHVIKGESDSEKCAVRISADRSELEWKPVGEGRCPLARRVMRPKLSATGTWFERAERVVDEVMAQPSYQDIVLRGLAVWEPQPISLKDWFTRVNSKHLEVDLLLDTPHGEKRWAFRFDEGQSFEIGSLPSDTAMPNGSFIKLNTQRKLPPAEVEAIRLRLLSPIFAELSSP